MARRYWGSESPIGKRLRVVFGGQGEWMTVVGVAGDAATGGLTMDASEPLLYTFGPGYSPALVVRAAPGASPMPAVRAAVSALTPSLPPASVASVADVIARSASGPRFTMLLLTIFTALALVLAAVGLYGVLAYAVAQRSREIGIRMALGASSREIARSVVGQGLMLALAGVGLGLLGAVWATKLIADLLYGVQPTDAASFAIGALVLVVTALVACIVPTRRAVAVDPLVAIRAE
jgi:predicted lysophospholipase L1 biosynthesis ABC-type transport system permease subunit